MTTKITEQNISNIANVGVQWQSVVTADGSTALNVTAGKGYFIDTSSAAQTVNLPSSGNTAGDTIILKDYARTWATNNVTMGSNTFDGISKAPTFSTSGQTITLVYMDNTKGWSLINEDTTTNLGVTFTEATGGTITTSGNFKIHTFTGDGCFVVSTGNSGPGSEIDYLVVAGGGSGGGDNGGGAGAGGFRTSNALGLPGPTTSPLASPTGLTLTAATYPITVGGGGAAKTHPDGNPNNGDRGSNSVFSTITSTGGGGGMNTGPTPAYMPGGSGGGGRGSCNGSGNAPPVSPPQGNDGGAGGGPANASGSGGGGGAGGAGGVATACVGGAGGIGSFISSCFAVSCAGTPGPVSCARYFSGGGGGSPDNNPGGPQSGGPGGSGGGGAGTKRSGPNGTPGTANTGGGGGGGVNPGSSGAGGKGIVLIRYKFQ